MLLNLIASVARRSCRCVNYFRFFDDGRLDFQLTLVQRTIAVEHRDRASAAVIFEHRFGLREYTGAVP